MFITFKHSVIGLLSINMCLSSVNMSSSCQDVKATDFVCLEPVAHDVGLIVWNGHAVTHTQHLQEVQEPIVLQQINTLISELHFTKISMVWITYNGIDSKKKLPDCSIES